MGGGKLTTRNTHPPDRPRRRDPTIGAAGLLVGSTPSERVTDESLTTPTPNRREIVVPNATVTNFSLYLLQSLQPPRLVNPHSARSSGFGVDGGETSCRRERLTGAGMVGMRPGVVAIDRAPATKKEKCSRRGARGLSSRIGVIVSVDRHANTLPRLLFIVQGRATVERFRRS
jgi:hypothetical protein